MTREERRRAARQFGRDFARRDGEQIDIPCPGCSTGFAILELEAGEPMQLHLRHDDGCPAIDGDLAARIAVQPAVTAALGLRNVTVVVLR